MKQIVRQASLTVEASLILPIFMFAMILVAYLGQLVMCQDDVQWALTRVAREASAEYGANHSNLYKSVAYYHGKFLTYMKDAGVTVSFLESRLLEDNDEIDLIVTYRMNRPFPILPLGSITMRQRVHTRAFTGVEQRGKSGNQDHRIVYVTETGRVYHLKLECTYLKLSISQLQYGDLATKRNDSGGKYKACEKCCKDKNLVDNTSVWITNYGDRYHTTASCSGLKRTVEEIPLSQVGTRTPCSKCGKEEGT